MNNQKNSLGKHFFAVLFFVVLVIVFVIFYSSNFKNEKNVEIEGQVACINDNCFNVEIAETNRERVKGLMNREFLDKDSGMLFIFPKEDIWSFWMKNTLIPLDIIWVNENSSIVEIKQNVQPCKENTCTIYSPKNKSKYVLEINAGLVDNLNITESANFSLNFSS